MTLRSDHVAGAALVILGVAVFALSGDLPFGTLSFPDAGLLPKIIASALIIFGVMLALQAGEGETFASIDWSDLRHAGPVIAITAVGIALYTVLGFLISIFLMLFGLLVLIERKNVLVAGAYSLAVTVLAYELFARVLASPMPTGPLGY